MYRIWNMCTLVFTIKVWVLPLHVYRDNATTYHFVPYTSNTVHWAIPQTRVLHHHPMS